MTNILLKCYGLELMDGADPKVRARVGRLSGIVGIGCNLLLFLCKIVLGTLTGAVSITADALNNLSDASSAIVTLLGFRMAGKPADAEHPYGHARLEYLSGLAVAALILVIGFELAVSSVKKILAPEPVAFSLMAALVLLGTIAVKLWLSWFNRQLGNTIHSAALLATAADSRNDVIATAAVLVSMTVEHLTDLRIDGFVGLAVAVFILISGLKMAGDTISPLLGEAADPELQAKLVDYIRSNPKVLGYHDLMVHDYGPGQRFASIHVEMDKNEDPLLCHEIIDDMERECLKSHGVHLVIHYDPVVTDDPALNRMRAIVTAILQVKDPRLSIHDFRMVPGTGHTNLIFDVTLPTDLRGQEAAVRSALEGALNGLGEGTFYTVITFDPTSFNEA